MIQGEPFSGWRLAFLLPGFTNLPRLRQFSLARSN